MISFEALWTLVSEEVVMHECLRVLDAQTAIFVVPVSAWRSNLFESPKALSAQHTIFVGRNAPRRLHEQLIIGFVSSKYYIRSSCERLGAQTTTFVVLECWAAMRVVDSYCL